MVGLLGIDQPGAGESYADGPVTSFCGLEDCGGARGVDVGVLSWGWGLWAFSLLDGALFLAVLVDDDGRGFALLWSCQYFSFNHLGVEYREGRRFAGHVLRIRWPDQGCVWDFR